ncbi:hypothetical protein BGZ83_010671 [Gryganskiella cystojenkinii]|nr:hypothetical protein BGZ83_010671 [Gryganskiella cystojenkinii]
MSPPTFESVFAIPELQALILQYFSSQDISRLSRSCKQMHQDLFLPLWRHIPPKEAVHLLYASVLGINVHLIQSLDLSKMDSYYVVHYINAMKKSELLQRSNERTLWDSGTVHRLKTVPLPDCLIQAFTTTTTATTTTTTTSTTKPTARNHEPNTLSRRWKNDSCLAHLTQLIQLTPRLTVLKIPGHMLLPSCEKSLSSFLHLLANNLIKLQSLTITIEGCGTCNCQGHYASLETALLFMCRSLELPDLVELRCDFEVAKLSNRDDLRDRTSRKIKEKIPQLFQACLVTLQDRSPTRIPHRLKTLQLPNTVWPLGFLVPFFETCIDGEDLVRLSVPWINSHHGGWAVSELEDAIKTSCPGIQHVEAKRLQHRDRRCGTRDSLGAVLKACEFGPGLKSITTCNVAWQEIKFAERLASHFHETLEEIVCLGNVAGDPGLMEIMEKCRNLKTVHAPWFHDKRANEGVVTSSPKWNCMHLTSLCLSMGPYSRHSAEDLERYYKSLGRLEHLVDLTLGYDYETPTPSSTAAAPTDLMMNDGQGGGYLAHLIGLRSLRRLCLQHDFWLAMGLAEIKFMDQHWTLLESITFLTENSEWLRRLLNSLYCWQELKRLRPSLEFKIVKSPFWNSGRGLDLDSEGEEEEGGSETYSEDSEEDEEDEEDESDLYESDDEDDDQ